MRDEQRHAFYAHHDVRWWDTALEGARPPFERGFQNSGSLVLTGIAAIIVNGGDNDLVGSCCGVGSEEIPSTFISLIVQPVIRGAPTP